MAVWGEGILDTPSLVRSQASHRWHDRGMWGIPVCSLLASWQTASFTMENGFFQWCHPIWENNKEYSVLKHNIFTSIGSTAYYTLESSLTLTHIMGTNYPLKIRIQHFQFAKKLTQKWVPTQDLLAPAEFIIKNYKSPFRCHHTPVNIEQKFLWGLSTTSLTVHCPTHYEVQSNLLNFSLVGGLSPLQFFLHNNVPQTLQPDTLYNKSTA
jgi:hypothetical protein